MTLTHLSLCSGIGGLDLAAEWAEFKTVGQCEIDEYASRVLSKNFKGVHNFGDIRTITIDNARSHGIEPGTLTVISAGFPCQPYSIAGKGLGASDSRDLALECVRVVGELKPRWFIGENVFGLLTRSNGRYMRTILAALTSLGYRVTWGVWGACDVGAPHQRDRIFIVGHSKISYTAIQRQCESPLQSREPKKNLRQKSKRRVQTCGRESSGVCGGQSHNPKNVHNSSGWQTEPDVGRVANGIPARVDRLRVLGNAVVPQQAYPLYKAIKNLPPNGR